ncbi:MAG: hypothetical protein ACKVE4_00720 [Dissulfuribacterales bacterium]
MISSEKNVVIAESCLSLTTGIDPVRSTAIHQNAARQVRPPVKKNS